MRYTTLMDDIIFRMDEYNKCFAEDDKNNRYPVKQRETWAPKGKSKAITQQSIGCDSENCIRLLKECGFDGEPVSSQKNSTTRKWFESTNGHTFPPPNDILRLAIFFNLDLYESLHIVLKSEFEKFLIEGNEEWAYLKGTPFMELISFYQNEKNEEKLLDVFHDFCEKYDPDRTYALFENHWHFSSVNGYDRNSFSSLINQYFLTKLVFSKNNSQKIKNLAEQEKKLIDQMKFGTPETQETLWRKRCIWQVLLDDLDDVYFDIEKRRLRNAEVEQDYLRLFGDVIIIQIGFESTVKLLEIRIALKRTNPELTDAELEEKILETQKQLFEDLEELKLKSAIALDQTTMEAWSKCGIPMDAEMLNEEISLCKKEIRTIRKLVHPDILMNNPEYKNLTEEQKKELEEILLDALKIAPSELGYPPNYAYHDMRSLQGLQQVRMRIESILKINNIEIDLKYQIQGETVQEQIDWLEREIKILENRLNSAKGQLNALMTDPEVQSKSNLIGNKKQQEEFRTKMEERNEVLLKQSQELEREWEELRKEEKK
jgi:hypothetical protein